MLLVAALTTLLCVSLPLCGSASAFFLAAQPESPSAKAQKSQGEEDAHNRPNQHFELSVTDELFQLFFAEWLAADHDGASWHEIMYADRTRIAVLKTSTGKVYLVEDIPLQVRVFV